MSARARSYFIRRQARSPLAWPAVLDVLRGLGAGVALLAFFIGVIFWFAALEAILAGAP